MKHYGTPKQNRGQEQRRRFYAHLFSGSPAGTPSGSESAISPSLYLNPGLCWEAEKAKKKLWSVLRGKPAGMACYI
jgi:hypothetical protein